MKVDNVTMDFIQRLLMRKHTILTHQKVGVNSFANLKNELTQQLINRATLPGGGLKAPLTTRVSPLIYKLKINKRSNKMKCKIQFDLNNSAFIPDYPSPKGSKELHLDMDETAETIQLEVCNKIREGKFKGIILDKNNNTIGKWVIK